MFNYCKVTNRGAITSDFIGDLALTYAVNRVKKDITFSENFFQRNVRAPNYKELRDLNFYFTVARPLKLEMTGLYTRNTLFSIDGYPNVDALIATGKNLFKNYFYVQGILPDSEFSACLICHNSFELPLPFTIRLGTGRECLALVEKDEPFNTNDWEIWLNAFTLKWVFGNLMDTVKELTNCNNLFFDYKLENYILIKKISLEQVKTIFKGAFDG